MPNPQIDRLKSTLLTSGIQTKEPALFQVINQLIDFIRINFANLSSTIASSSSSGGGGLVAPIALTDIIDATIDSILLGRGDSGTGPWEEITLGSGLVMTGITLSVIPDTFIEWSVLTNGDPVTPEVIFAGGDVIMVHVP